MQSSGRRPLLLAMGTIGFGLGGFFDGILLHQVLQWHHLLSLVPGETFRDLGTQILADGLFHVLMYAVTAVGLWLLWRRRQLLDQEGSGLLVAGGGLMGFGLWNLFDVGFFHWIVEIHRIRIDVPEPMLYDIGWLIAFGLLPMLCAFLLLRRRVPPGGGGKGSVRSATALSILAVTSAMMAALPQRDAGSALVLLAPGVGPAGGVNAARSAGAPIIWIDPDGRMMVVALQANASTGRLYGAGALLVTRSPAVAGCAAWLRA